MPNATDAIKYERKYHVEILGGFSLESRSDLAMPSDGNPRYTPCINPLCPGRDETCRARGLTFTICRRYPSSIKSLLHPVKISRVVRGGPSSANISGSRVARYCNLTYDPPLPTQLYLNTHRCLSVCLFVCHHGFVIGRFLTTDRAGSCSVPSCISICAVLRKLSSVPVPLDKKSLAAIWTNEAPFSCLPRRGLG